MDGIEKVNPVYPNWQDRPKQDRQKKPDREELAKKRQSDPRQKTPGDGRPHIDEFV